MAWTAKQKLNYLLQQPWTIVTETTPEGDNLLRVQELPAAVGCGDDTASLEADFWESFVTTLEAYIAVDAIPPLPHGAHPVPWLEQQLSADKIAATAPRVFRFVNGQTRSDVPATTASQPREVAKAEWPEYASVA